MGLSPGLLPGRVSLEEGRAWYEHAWGAGLPESPGLDATGILAAASEGRMHGLVLLGADPREDHPDRTLAGRALDGAGFVVAVDCFLTESSRRAHVVLPAATYAERAGTFTNLEGRITRLGRKVTPPGRAWPDWMIAVELADRLGADLGFTNLDGIWEEIERVSPAHAGVTGDLLASRRAKDGVVVPLRPTSLGVEPGTGRPGGGPAALDLATDTGSGVDQAPPAPIDPMADPGIGSVETQGVPASAVVRRVAVGTPTREPGDESGPAAEASSEAGAGASSPDAGDGVAPGAGDAPDVTEPEEGVPARPPLIRFGPAGLPVPVYDAYSLRLVATRTLWDKGTFLARSPHLAGLHPEQRLRVNPYDLDRLGVTTGAQVRVVSSRASATSMVLDVVADDGVPRGSAALLYGLPGEGPAELIDATAPVVDVRLETR
jgi:anaerobic selenocysteine-containing dehydrogenase